MHNKRHISVWNILKGEIQSAQQVWRDYLIPHAGNGHKPHIWRRHHVHLLAGLLLASKVALVVILFSFVPHGAELSPQVEQAMVDQTNQYRQQLQETTLQRNAYLDSVALARANDMVAKNYFSHYAPDGRKPWEWVDTKQYNYSRFGENLAMDFVTAEAVFKAFVASPTHEKNLHNPNYQDIGVAMVSGMIDNRDTNVMVVLYGTKQTPVIPVLAENKPVTPAEAPITKPVVAKPITKPISKPVSKPIVTSPDKTTNPPQLVAVNPAPIQPTEVKGIEAQVEEPAVTPIVIKHDGSWIEKLISYSHDIYFLILIAFLVMALMNIFIAIRVQHGSIVIASFLMIALAGYLWLVNWHSAESLTNGISLLGLSL